MGKLIKSEKAVVYTRVSSEKQVENCSLDYQAKCARNYAAKNNIKIEKVFREEGYSGRNTNRPAYRDMIKYLENNDIDVILIYKLDRLHRDETNMFNDIKRFNESNIKIIAIADSIDTSDDSAMVATAMYTVIGANFSRNLSKETRKGLESIAANNMFTGGIPPYGFKVNRDTMQLEIDKMTAPAVKKIFELYADGFRTSEICKWLKDNGYKTSKGNDFKANTLNEILHNEKYRGCYTWDKATPKDSNGKRNSHKFKTEYVRNEGGCPCIVSDNIFRKVQKRLEENANKAKNRTPDRYYPLTGLIYCKCGATMNGGISYSKGKKYHKYNCSKRCGAKSIRAEYLEKSIFNALKKCLFSSPNIENIINALNDLSESEKFDSDKEYQKLRSKLTGLETSHENLMQVLEKGKAIKSIMNRLERIEAEKEQVSFKIKNMKRESHVFSEDDLSAIQGGFYEYLQKNNNVNNRYFLKGIIERIVVDNDDISIKFKSGISVDKETKNFMKGTK